MNIVRVTPKSFKGDWKAGLEELGIRVPDTIPITRYTPVNHDPTPFSIELDLDARTVVRKVEGVMPNALYRGVRYSWEAFCERIQHGK